MHAVLIWRQIIQHSTHTAAALTRWWKTPLLDWSDSLQSLCWLACISCMHIILHACFSSCTLAPHLARLLLILHAYHLARISSYLAHAPYLPCLLLMHAATCYCVARSDSGCGLPLMRSRCTLPAQSRTCTQTDVLFTKDRCDLFDSCLARGACVCVCVPACMWVCVCVCLHVCECRCESAGACAATDGFGEWGVYFFGVGRPACSWRYD